MAAVILLSSLARIHAGPVQTPLQIRSESLLRAVVREFVVSDAGAKYFRKIDRTNLVISTNCGPDGMGWNQMWAYEKGIAYNVETQRVQRVSVPVFENNGSIYVHVFTGYEHGFGKVDWQKKFRIEDKLDLCYFIETKKQDDGLTKTLDSIIVRVIGAGSQTPEQVTPRREGQ